MNDRLVALKPSLFISHAPANAQIILGTDDGVHVVAKMSLPDVHGVQEENFEIVYRGSEQAAMTIIRNILKPLPLKLAAVA